MLPLLTAVDWTAGTRRLWCARSSGIEGRQPVSHLCRRTFARRRPWTHHRPDWVADFREVAVADRYENRRGRWRGLLCGEASRERARPDRRPRSVPARDRDWLQPQGKGARPFYLL